MEVDKKPAPIDTSDDLAKIIECLKSNNNRATSVYAIKKYLNIKAKPRRIVFNNCLKLALKNGDLEQVSGKGATGSFRMPKDKKKKV